MGEPPQLGQLRQQGQRHDRADARDALQQVILLAPEGAGPQPLAHVLVDFPQVRLEPGKMGLDAGTHERHPRRPQAILLRGPHRHHLPSPLDERHQRLGRLLRQRARGGTHGLAEIRHCLRIQPIGLRQAPGGAGKVASVTRIDHGDRQAGTPQLRHERRVVAPGGLDHDHVRVEGPQPPNDFGDPGRLIGQLPCFALRPDRDVQRRLGHLDPDDHVFRLVPRSSLVLSCRPPRLGLAGYGISTWLALAPVRAHRGAGRDDPSSSAASRGRGMSGLSRPRAACHWAILHDS